MQSVLGGLEREREREVVHGRWKSIRSCLCERERLGGEVTKSWECDLKNCL